MCSYLKFTLKDDYVLQINSNVIQKLNLYRQDNIIKKESGGVIIGRFLEDSFDIVIDEVTTPFIRDVRKRCYFKRSMEEHQSYVIKKWKESNGTQNYFGEWHTHAEDIPVPSNTDINDWKKRIKNDIKELDFLISIIVGIKSIKVWLTDSEMNINELKQIHDD